MNLLKFFSKKDEAPKPEELVSHIFYEWKQDIGNDSFFETNKNLKCSEKELKSITVIAGQMYFQLTESKTVSFIRAGDEELFSNFFLKLFPYTSQKITQFSLQEVVQLLEILRPMIEAGTIGMDLYYSKVCLEYFFQSLLVFREQGDLPGYYIQLLRKWHDVLPKNHVYYVGTGKINQKLQLSKIVFHDSNFIEESSEYFCEEDAFGAHANKLLSLFPTEQKKCWAELIVYCRANEISKITKKHTHEINLLMQTISIDQYLDVVLIFIEHIEKMNATQGDYTALEFIHTNNRDILKGIFLGLGSIQTDMSLQLLHRGAMVFYKKIPNKGPAAIALGNICVSIMSEYFGMKAISYLFILRYKTKHPSIQNYIDKQIQKVGERIGYSKDMLEDISVRDYQIKDRSIEYVIGDQYYAVLPIGVDLSVGLIWKDRDDKVYKKLPEAISDEFDEHIREIKQQKKELQALLSYQRYRFETLLLTGRRIPISHFRQYFLQNTTANLIASTLIWNVYNQDNEKINTIFFDVDIAYNLTGNKIDLKENDILQLYHPLEAGIDTDGLWGEKLKSHDIIQAIKQVSREVFSKTYGIGRFINIPLFQHQAVAIAKERYWQAKLQGDFDSGDEGFIKRIPTHNIMVQLDMEPNRDGDINNAGIFSETSIHRIYWKQLDTMSTIDSDKIDDRVFSEVVRDISLIVTISLKK